MGNHIILDYCPSLAYKILLILLHSLICSYRRLNTILTTIWKCYVALGQKVWKNDVGKSLVSLQQDSSTFNKLPKHLGIIYTDSDHICINDLSNIVSWAIAFGVTYVSLYDNEGKLKLNQDLIERKISKKLKKLMGESFGNYSLTLKDSTRSYDNGYVHTKGVCVQVLSIEDGRQDIINVAKELARQVLRNDQDYSDVDDSVINSSLRGTKGLPDPELVFQFGNVLILDGFLPWQSRLTEIISFPDHENIIYKDFLNAFKQYTKCEQRLGK